MNKWNGNLLKDEKGYILSGVIKNKQGYTVISYRNKSYMDFDGFRSFENAKTFAEKSVRSC